MDVSTPPSLDLACPQAEADIKNMSTCLEIEVSIKIKYGHEGIMIILITATYIFFSYDSLCSSNKQVTMSSMVHKLHWELTNYNLSH